MNFTTLRERTEDLTGAERKLVFDLLPEALQDESWAKHAEWVAERSLVDEWLASGTSYSLLEWEERDADR